MSGAHFKLTALPKLDRHLQVPAKSLRPVVLAGEPKSATADFTRTALNFSLAIGAFSLPRVCVAGGRRPGPRLRAVAAEPVRNALNQR